MVVIVREGRLGRVTGKKRVVLKSEHAAAIPKSVRKASIPKKETTKQTTTPKTSPITTKQPVMGTKRTPQKTPATRSPAELPTFRVLAEIERKRQARIRAPPTITTAPRKSVTQRLAEEIGKAEQIRQEAQIRQEPEAFKQAAKATILGVAKGTKELAEQTLPVSARPKYLAKGAILLQTIKERPHIIGPAIGEELRTRPASTVGEIIPTFLLFGGVGRIFRATTPSTASQFVKSAEKFDKQIGKISAFEKEPFLFHPTARAKTGFKPLDTKAIEKGAQPELATITTETQTQLKPKPYDPLTSFLKEQAKTIKPEPKPALAKGQITLPTTIRTIKGEKGQIIGLTDKPITRPITKVPDTTVQTTLEGFKTIPKKQAILFTDTKGQRVLIMGKKGTARLAYQNPFKNLFQGYKRIDQDIRISRDPLTGTIITKKPSGIPSPKILPFSLELQQPTKITSVTIQKPKSITKTKSVLEDVRTADITKIRTEVISKPKEDVIPWMDVKTRKKTKAATKTVTVSKTLLLSQQATEQIPKTKTITQQVTKQRIARPKKIKKPRVPRIPFISPKRKKEKTTITKRPSPQLIRKAFGVLIKRRGQFFPVTGKFTKGAALDILAEKLTKTLAATGKIVPIKGAPTITRRTGEFGRARKQLRTFKIVKGKKVPQPDTFIQKRGKRLGTKKEVEEIQFFKKKKKKIGGFL